MSRQPTYTELSYLKFAVGKRLPCVLVDAVHAAKPRSELYTGEIVEAVAARTRCHCIIATVSRDVADLNRPPDDENREGIEEYRSTIRSMLRGAGLLGHVGELSQPFLHLAIHGFEDRDDFDIDLGTRHGRCCTDVVRNWIHGAVCFWAETYKRECRELIVAVDRLFRGDQSKEFHSRGHPATGYPGYGPRFNTVQVEIAYWLREYHRGSLISMLATLARAFAENFGSG
jgi:hypothetical protein